MSLRIRQIVFAARELAPTVAQFERELGIEVAFRDPQVAEFGLENAVLPIGDQFLEVVVPVRANTAAGRHLDRHGDSAYMLILQTDDLPRDRERFTRLGVRTVWSASYPDISAVHVHPKELGAAIVSIDQPIPPASWRWAGPDWQRHVGRNGASEILEVSIAARDPEAMAQRWSQVLGIDTPTPHTAGFRIPIERGALDFVKAADDHELIRGYKLAMATRPATRLCGTDFQSSG